MALHRMWHDRIDQLVTALGPGPWGRDELLALGWSPGMLSRSVDAGVLQRSRRGVYSLPGDAVRQLALAVDVRLPRLRVIARGLDSSAVFSHATAAEAHGLWLPRRPDPRVHVTIPGQAERQDAGLVVHGSGLPPGSIVHLDGVALTDVPRTAIDLARPEDLPHALVAVDGALRELLRAAHPRLDRALRDGRVGDEEVQAARSRLDQVVQGMVGWPGVRTARAAVAAADPASASPYESWSRGWMLAVGMPRPALNVPVRGASGRLYFGDFVWEEHGVIAEADGESKYGESAASVRAALRAEKERQADLEAAGWRFARWMPGVPGATIAARVSRVLHLASGAPSRTLDLGA